jgi:hypothetical protein
VVAPAAEVEHPEVAPVALGEGFDGGEVDRAGTLAAADDEQAAGLRWNPETLPGRLPVRRQDLCRHRPPGNQVALALAPRDREGETDPPRPPGE